MIRLPLYVAVVIAGLLAAAGPARAVDRSQPPPLATPAPFAMPVPVELNLKNGVKVWFLERHRAPLVDIIAVVRGGALADPPGHEGVAFAVADLLTEGAGARDAFAFDDAVKALGADIGAASSWTSTSVGLHVTSARLGDALPLLADALLRPRLDDRDWARKRDERIGEMTYLRDDPRTLAQFAAARALYPTGRFGVPPIGTAATLTATTAEDLRAFHAAFFRPDNAFFVVVGDVSKAQLVPLLERHFAGWIAPGTPVPTVTPTEPAPLSGVEVVLLDRPGAPQSAVQVVAPIPADVPPLDPATGVMRTLLGGSFTSRLNDNLREEHGYTYGASYSIETTPVHRSRVTTSVATPVTAPALNEIFTELRRIAEPPTAAEVERARSYEALNMFTVLDGGRALAQSWAGWKERRIPDEAVTRYVARTLAVDVAAVAAAGKRLVDPTRVTVVVVGDAATLSADLGRFGPVRRMSADELLPLPAPPK